MISKRRKLDPVEAFRRLSRRGFSTRSNAEPLSLRSRLILGILTVQIIFLGWSIGGVRAGTVVPFFGLAMMGVCLLFVPLGRVNALQESAHGPRQYLRQLLRWPFFWCALLCLGYIFVQNLNPAWEYRLSQDGKVFRLFPIEHIAWLPTGVVAPFEKMNGWRQLLIYASAVGMLVLIWCGGRRRRHLIYLLWVSVLSTTTMVIVGLIQRLTEATHVLWVTKITHPLFFGTFTYKNHAGAFIFLNLAIALALAVYYFRVSRRRNSKSSPHGFLLLNAMLMAVGVFYTDSRGAMLILAGFCVCSLLLFLLEFLKTRSEHSNLWAGVVFACGALGFGWFLSTFIDFDKVEGRLNVLLDDVQQLDQGNPDASSVSTKMRYFIYTATIEMIKDRPVFGWGAGIYRYYFPVYQVRYPDIHYTDWIGWGRDPKTGKSIKMPHRTYHLINNAHNDGLQFLAEYGVVGVGLMLAAVLSLILPAITRLRRMRLWMWVMVVGLVGTVVHSCVDFVFQSPSIIYLWLGVVAILVKYLKLSKRYEVRQS